MIKEDYVSFETAKLLKEKGFNWECFQYWHKEDNELVHSQSMYPIQNISNPCFFGPAAPTLQMAMKWLREVHNRHISIEHSYVLNRYKFYITKYNPNNISDLNNTLYSADYYFSTYEEACEAVIKYCLENLI